MEATTLSRDTDSLSLLCLSLSLDALFEQASLGPEKSFQRSFPALLPILSALLIFHLLSASGFVSSLSLPVFLSLSSLSAFLIRFFFLPFFYWKFMGRKTERQWGGQTGRQRGQLRTGGHRHTCVASAGQGTDTRALQAQSGRRLSFFLSLRRDDRNQAVLV